VRRLDWAYRVMWIAWLPLMSCGGLASVTADSPSGEPANLSSAEPAVSCPAMSRRLLFALNQGGVSTSVGGLAQQGPFLYFTITQLDDIEGTPSAAGVYRVSKCGGVATKLADDGESPGTIAVDATHVYWGDSIFGSVMSLPREGGAARVLVHPSENEPSGVRSLVEDATSLYWATIPTGYVPPPYGMQVRGMHKDGTADTALLSSNSFSLSVVAGSAGIYIGEASEAGDNIPGTRVPSVYRTSSGAMLSRVEAGTSCQLLTVDETYAYCGSSAGIIRLPLDRGSPPSLLDLPHAASGAAVADGKVYVTTSCSTLPDSVTCRVNDAELRVIDASGVETSLVTELAYPTFVVVDEVNAYFADNAGGIYAIERSR
jgi:hypothetical protein